MDVTRKDSKTNSMNLPVGKSDNIISIYTVRKNEDEDTGDTSQVKALASSSHGNEIKQSIIIQNLKKDLINKLEEKYAYIVRDTAGRIAGKIHDCSFECDKIAEVDINDARILLMDSVEHSLNAFNNDENLKPHMVNYPFTEKNIGFGICFVDKQGYRISSKHIARAVLIRDTIFYSVYDSDNDKLIDVYKESYEDSLAFFKNKKSPPNILITYPKNSTKFKSDYFDSEKEQKKRLFESKRDNLYGSKDLVGQKALKEDEILSFGNKLIFLSEKALNPALKLNCTVNPQIKKELISKLQKSIDSQDEVYFTYIDETVCKLLSSFELLDLCESYSRTGNSKGIEKIELNFLFPCNYDPITHKVFIIQLFTYLHRSLENHPKLKFLFNKKAFPQGPLEITIKSKDLLKNKTEFATVAKSSIQNGIIKLYAYSTAEKRYKLISDELYFFTYSQTKGLIKVSHGVDFDKNFLEFQKYYID